jgi:serine/threonine-protein kinase ATR
MASAHVPQRIWATRYLKPETIRTSNLLTLIDALLNQFEAFKSAGIAISRFLPLAIEACWITSKWDKLGQYADMCSKQNIGDFNVGVGSALNALRHGRIAVFKGIIDDLRDSVAKSLTANSVTSLQSCHGSLLQLHALAEMETIAYSSAVGSCDSSMVVEVLDRRLEVLGGYLSEKQYILGLRRANMELS